MVFFTSVPLCEWWVFLCQGQQSDYSAQKEKKKELQLDIVQDKRKNAYSFFLNNFFPWKKKKKRKATEKNTPKHP